MMRESSTNEDTYRHTHIYNLLETLVCRCKDDSRTGFMSIGNPRLGSIDNPAIISIILGRRRHGSTCIRSIARLGKSKTTDLEAIIIRRVRGTTSKRSNPLLMLRRRSKGLNGIQIQRVVGTHNDTNTGTSSTNFFL